MFTVETAATAAYVVAALLFILALAGLSKHETSKAGNTFGMAGMAVALIATVGLALDRHIEPLGLGLLVGAMAIGAAIGLWRARVVEMTGMPELIALLHSFVGLAAVLVGWNGYLAHPAIPAELLQRFEKERPVVLQAMAAKYACEKPRGKREPLCDAALSEKRGTAEDIRGQKAMVGVSWLVTRGKAGKITYTFSATPEPEVVR